MLTTDYEVLEHLSTWVSQGEFPWLCTIVKAVGSSPRPIGSLVGISASKQIGSVSGGCVEEELLQRIETGQYTGERPELIEYGISALQNERLGLPCGGRLTLLLQQLREADKAWLTQTLAALEKRSSIERQLDCTTGQTETRSAAQFSQLHFDGQRLRQYFGPRMRMILVGAGDLAHKLSELALAMDYEVLVTDPRQERLSQWQGPALQLIQGMPDDVIREQGADQYSIIITLTHDPRIDDMALMEALESNAWYIGALGSARTTRKRLARLQQLGMAEHHIARLRAPVGLDIGSKTPIEIAVAIMAELTQLQRRPAS